MVEWDLAAKVKNNTFTNNQIQLEGWVVL